MKVTRSVFLYSLLLSATASTQAARLFAFGDSLTDTGNVYAATGGANPAAPYWQGRYSNGPVWAERLASGLGLSVDRSLTGGTNYAYGGAQLNPNSALSSVGTPNVGAQLGQFQLGGNSFVATDLVVLWAGGNDFLNGATNPTLVASYVTQHMTSMYALGARRFLIPNLPLLGYTPGLIGTGGETLANFASVAFNANLASNLATFRTNYSGTTVHELDIATLFETVRTSPGGYGLTNVTQSYLATGGNPDQFLFWDNVHPTRGVHDIVGRAALAAVPEPGSIVALGLGCVVLLRRRK
jgi:thermolabile hemolysin